MFATYFRILKKASNSVLLSSVLEGLAKFAHLINIDFFDDLVKVLYTLIDTGVSAIIELSSCINLFDYTNKFFLKAFQGIVRITISLFVLCLNVKDLKYRESLHCVLTAFQILSGQGDVLNIDPTKFYSLLYVTMTQVHAGKQTYF